MLSVAQPQLLKVISAGSRGCQFIPLY